MAFDIGLMVEQKSETITGIPLSRGVLNSRGGIISKQGGNAALSSLIKQMV